MNFIYHHLRHSRGILLFSLLAGTISGLCSTGIVVLVHKALSTNETQPGSLVRNLIALSLIGPIANFVSGSLLVRLSQGIMLDIRMQLCRRVLATPLRQLEKIGASRVLASLTSDVITITNTIVNVPILCINTIIVISCLIYLGWLSWVVLLTAFAFVVVGVGSYLLPMSRASRRLRQARVEQDELFKHFRALTDGAKELKLHHLRREAFLKEGLETAADEYRRLSVTGMTIYNMATSWGYIMFYFLICLLLFFVPTISNISNQTLTGCILVLLYMMGPLQGILNMVPALSQASIAFKKVESMGISLVERPEETALTVTSDPKPSWHSLEMIGVAHTYQHESEDQDFNVGPINLSFQPGELVFLTGGNGSGKTTLAKLLTGLYIPEAGEIRLDGQVIADENREYYRQLFSVVFSDFYLFDKFLGLKSEALDAKAREYLVRLQLERKVTIEDNQLSTIDLSQGQRKRLALLTAYLEDRPIYLFDEWAADQDPFFKEIFYLQLLPTLKAEGKTVIVISHDDRYYHVADRLIKLDYGQLVCDKALEGSANKRLIEDTASLRSMMGS
jgi:putative ATP-binding cassette transporter